MKREEESFNEKLSNDVYESAVKEFAKTTIHNPDFFKLSKEEQKAQAMAFLQKKKGKRGME